jgi:putative ABC transport system permease protein
MATMTASVLERRKEIGFLKALGAGNWEISLLFLGEAGIIGILGGFIGFGLGILFSIWIGEWVFNSTITPRIVVLVVVLLLSVGISFVASLMPLRKAAGILPAAVLKGS